MGRGNVELHVAICSTILLAKSRECDVLAVARAAECMCILMRGTICID